MKKLLDSTEVEQIILGSILSSPDCYIQICDSIQREYFLDKRNLAIFEEIQRFDSNGTPIDQYLITQKLMDEEIFEGVAKYISQLQNLAEPSNIKYYSVILLEKYLRRNLIQRANKIITDSADKEIGVFDLLSEAEAHITDIHEEIEDSFKDDGGLSERIDDIFSELETKINSKQQSEGLSLRTLPTLNNFIGGIMPGDLIGVYGKEKSTKTTIAHEIALDIGVDQNIPAAIFSFEVSRKELEWKSISMRTGTDYFKLRNPKGYSDESKMSLEELEQLKKNTKEIFSNSSLFIFDKIMNEYQIFSKIKQLIKKHGIKLVVIDYLMLLESAKRFKDRRLELNHLSMFFKRAAMRLQIPIILISQSNADGERAAEAKGLERDSNYFIYVEKGKKAERIKFYEKLYGEYEYVLGEDEYLATLRGIRHGRGNRTFITKFENNRYVEVNTKPIFGSHHQEQNNHEWFDRKDQNPN